VKSRTARFSLFIKERLKELRFLFRRFSKREQITAYVLLALMLISGGYAARALSTRYSTEMPRQGGSLKEGIVGRPGFANPLLAAGSADHDIVALVYSGLYRIGENGLVVPDLAEKTEISDDGLTYTVTLKKNLTWHDGTAFTARDVLFTITLVKDRAYKSPLRANWEGVSVSVPDDGHIVFVLRKPYAPFLQNLTLGIIPKHIWEGKSPENFPIDATVITPIGTGPFRVKQIVRNQTTGVPERLELASFDNFALGRPFLKTITLSFYPNEEALLSAYEKKEVDSFGPLSKESAETLEGKSVHEVDFPLLRVFAIFLNQSEAPVLLDKNVRAALAQSAPRQKIIDQVLAGKGSPLSGPLAPGMLGYVQTPTGTSTEPSLLLQSAGWTLENGVLVKRAAKKTERLSFSIATANVPELIAAASLVKEAWQAFGAEVEVKLFELGDFEQNVIRSRDYDALFFGLQTKGDPDPYAFWHSSERLDPGLNVALYTNKTVDSILEKSRGTKDPTERATQYQNFSTELAKDNPAIFLYAPYYRYVAPRNIKGITPLGISDGSDRFSNVYTWYRYTERVWNIFIKK
jgi:peptide/nickel transport system substrate-binding protein